MSRIFHFEIHRAPSELLLPSAKNLPRKAEFFIIIFKLKYGNFKTRDFSPLIERVLAGVSYVMLFFFC